MSDCGCKGHYHNGDCSDVNAVFWEAGRCPVNPTEEEIAEQKRRNGVSLNSMAHPPGLIEKIVDGLGLRSRRQ